MFQLVYGKNGHRVLNPKDERDQHSLATGAKANGMGDLHLCEGTIDMEAYGLYRDINCHQDDIFLGS